jgi:hypothetical protein
MSCYCDQARFLAMMDNLRNLLGSLSCTQLWLFNFWILGMALQRLVDIAIGFCYTRLMGSFEEDNRGGGRLE